MMQDTYVAVGGWCNVVGCPASRPRRPTTRLAAASQRPEIHHNEGQDGLFDAMAARQGAPARNLSLTEELEKLEQSITLTLQGEAPAATSALAA